MAFCTCTEVKSTEWAEVAERLIFSHMRGAIKALVLLYQINTPKNTMGHSLILISEEQGEKANFTLNKLDH